MTALTHSTDWHTGPALQGPAVCRAGARARGRDERRARLRDGCRAGTADFRWEYRGKGLHPGRARADGDDFNLSESCDGWAESGLRSLTARTGGLVYHCANPPFRVTARTHPSSILQSSGPGSGSGGQWLRRAEARERIGCLLWQSEILMGEKRSEGPRHVLNTNWWWRRALWTWLELKYRVLSPLSARRDNFL